MTEAALSVPGAPGALFEEVIARRTDLDMHTKMREDPLYAIRYVLCMCFKQ